MLFPIHIEGAVIISMKDNSPCFSVANEDRKSSFSIVVSGENPEAGDSWSYVNNSLNQLPNISTCIKIKNFSLSNIKLDALYNVTLGATNVAYMTDFCITKKK